MPLLNGLIVPEYLGHHQVEAGLDWAGFITQLRDWFAAGAVQAPPRQVLPITQPDGSEASLLIMPAWVPGQAIGVKVVTFLPANAKRGLATINAGYLLFDGNTGQMTASMDGDALTARRTAAASALAADYLARRDAKNLLVVGTGQLAQAVAEAHGAVRTYRQVQIWGRSPEKAAKVAAALCDQGLNATAVENLQAACGQADVISTVTASRIPVVQGAWLRAGSHLDLIGSFKADMRESDDRAIQQAALFVDGKDGAVLSGDLAQPVSAGVIDETHIQADLTALCRGDHSGRMNDTEFTAFKSVGMALEDLAAAMRVTEAAQS